MSSNRFFRHTLSVWAGRQDFHRDFDDLVSEVLIQVIRHVLQGLFRVIGVDDFFGGHGFHGVHFPLVCFECSCTAQGFWISLGETIVLREPENKKTGKTSGSSLYTGNRYCFFSAFSAMSFQRWDSVSFF